MEICEGHVDEFVTLSWDFKLDSGFLPPYSFCHIFQLKAVDGDDSMPLITLTPRKSTPNELQLLHYNSKQELWFLKTVQLQVISLSGHPVIDGIELLRLIVFCRNSLASGYTPQ